MGGGVPSGDKTYRSQIPRMMYLTEGEKIITFRVCVIYLATDTLETRKLMEEILYMAIFDGELVETSR